MINLLDRVAAGTSAQDRAGFNADVVVAAGDVELPGRLNLPDGATGLVVFAHGSGSGPCRPPPS